MNIILGFAWFSGVFDLFFIQSNGQFNNLVPLDAKKGKWKFVLTNVLSAILLLIKHQQNLINAAEKRRDDFFSYLSKLQYLGIIGHVIKATQVSRM